MHSQHDVGCKRSLELDMFTRSYATFGRQNNEYRVVLERNRGVVLGGRRGVSSWWAMLATAHRQPQAWVVP
ncbi:hypothetical protein Terro_3128 [Terriglobus roseus DSM 18391]|uniref:Uncharacterized protein n=1 Tax=Terriglobus roseus (strain DSM 18391 / NRRL B-41598 / KBS 63) TaxID=926566 RepID=I3ZJE0_TERRK|nr:hypothetical protein [Terriglobus roseus]AFL89358.1 hypothetical protein Terro_3128 [Terriglobus roseus DSM 18391]